MAPVCRATVTQEFLHFLRRIDAETPAVLDLHLVVYNSAPHKHCKVKAWLKHYPRCHLHFTPTSASWLNMVERFFRDLTTRRVRAVSSTVRPKVNRDGRLPPPS